MMPARRWFRAHVLAVDVVPHGGAREPWSTWRPAGESFAYLRAFATHKHTVMVGVLPR